MTVRRCPKCHSVSDDMYGFCIKCGYEFPEAEKEDKICPLCNYQNPDEADFCVKCGAPLAFKDQFENVGGLNNGIIIKRISTDSNDSNIPHTSRFLIILGYIFSVLGGLIGLIIAIYLVTRKDPVAKKHGYIQLAIFVFYFILILVLMATGILTMEYFNQYNQLLSGNYSNLTNLTLL